MRRPKFLIEMKHGLGDCVCMLPAVDALRGKYPDAYIAMIVNGSSNTEIFNRSAAKIDHFYFLSLKDRPLLQTVKTVYMLRKEHFDYGILAVMTPKKKGQMLFRLIGIKHPLGEQYRGMEFLDLDDTVHFVDRNIDLIKNLVDGTVDKQPHIVSVSSNTDLLNKKFNIHNKKIIVNIGGGDKNYYRGTYVYTRNWNPAYMIELVDLLSSLDYDICLLGGVLEKELLDAYSEVLKKRNVFNCIAKTSISESIDFIADAVLSIGVDTGMQHVADALGVPTVSIFGPTNPKTHGAYSNKAVFVECEEETSDKHCFGTDIYYGSPIKQCMELVTPDRVFLAVKNILKLN